MKTYRLLVVLAALLFAGMAAPAPARANAEVSFDFFYDSLAPYGEWVDVGDYGLCWRPTNVDPDWTPYSDGYWAFTDAGWTWVSYEDFGGIVYHYGRWIRLDGDDGWCWTPGYEWGPAWVSWRSNDDYVGWAPLPPEARWQRDVGIGIWVDRTCDIGPGYYNFCNVRDFGAPVLRGVIINRGQNVTIIRNTVNITNITYNTGYFAGPVIYNGGPRFDVINRLSARPVPALRLVQNTTFDSAHWRDHRGPGGRMAFNAQTVGNQLLVPAPRVTPPSDPSALRTQAKRTIAGDKVGKGWGMVKNPEVQKELRQEMQRQSKGFTPETAPARAVAAADLKAVPTKADLKATPTATTTGDRHERSGRGQRPEGVAAQPNSVTPATPIAGNPNLKPFNAVTDPGQNPRGQNPKSPNAPATATFTPIPRGPDATGPGATGRNRPRTVDTIPQQPQQPPPSPQPDRAAEQAKIRAEQERAAQQKQAEMATQQQKQAEATAQQQKQAEAAAQQQKQTEIAVQQRKQAEIAAQQQKQAEIAAQQRKQAEMAAQQQKQAEAAAQQQKQAEMALRQKQIATQQEAAKAQADEYRRRQGVEQQRQQQQTQQQQQQTQQPQQQRGVDPRRAQQDGDRERARQQYEAQRNAQQQQQQQQRQQQQQPQQQQQKQQPQPQTQQQQNNRPANSSQSGGNNRGSKDGKDKDKDKNGN